MYVADIFVLEFHYIVSPLSIAFHFDQWHLKTHSVKQNGSVGYLMNIATNKLDFF